MASNTKTRKTAKNRIKVKDLPAHGKRLSGKDMKKVKGTSGPAQTNTSTVNHDWRVYARDENAN